MSLYVCMTLGVIVSSSESLSGFTRFWKKLKNVFGIEYIYGKCISRELVTYILNSNIGTGDF